MSRINLSDVTPPPRLREGKNWAQALCAQPGADPAGWEAPSRKASGLSEKKQRARERQMAAQACFRCPAIRECLLASAFERDLVFGTWANPEGIRAGLVGRELRHAVNDIRRKYSFDRPVVGHTVATRRVKGTQR